MKNISYCDTIERILISESIDCDGLIISNDKLEYSILYHSDALHAFTDDLLAIGASYISKEFLIRGIPKLLKKPATDIKDICATLSNINKTTTIVKTLTRTKGYLEQRDQLNKIDSLKYKRFYNAATNTHIWLNSKIAKLEFKDSLQTKLDPASIQGIYLETNNDQQLAIYLDHFSKQWVIENKLDTS